MSGPSMMRYFRIAVFAVIAASNAWRLATGSVTGGWMVLSLVVLAVSVGAILILLKQGGNRPAA